MYVWVIDDFSDGVCAEVIDDLSADLREKHHSY